MSRDHPKPYGEARKREGPGQRQPKPESPTPETREPGPPGRERQAAEAHQRARHLSVSIGSTVVASLVYLVVVLVTASRLPASMATHFDLAGEADDFMRTGAALVLQGVAVIGVPLALWAVLAAGRWWRGSSARLLSSVITGLSAGLTTLFVSLTLAQVGVTDVTTVRLHASTGLLAFGVGLATMALAALLLPRPLPPLPAIAVQPLRIAPSQRVSWFGKAHTSQAAMLVLGGAVLVLAVTTIATGIVWLWAVVALLLLLVFGVTRFDVRVDARGLAWRAALGVPRGRVKLAAITSVSVIEVSPGDFGGYGVRLLPGRLGLITRAGEALRVTHDRSELVITLDDARTAASVIEGLRQR